jgi:DIS3-like exonuclease 2
MEPLERADPAPRTGNRTPRGRGRPQTASHWKPVHNTPQSGFLRVARTEQDLERGAGEIVEVRDRITEVGVQMNAEGRVISQVKTMHSVKHVRFGGSPITPPNDRTPPARRGQRNARKIPVSENNLPRSPNTAQRSDVKQTVGIAVRDRESKSAAPAAETPEKVRKRRSKAKRVPRDGSRNRDGARSNGNLPQGEKRTPGSSSKKMGNGRRRSKSRFPDYLSLEEVERGLKEGWLYKGSLRINPRRRSDSYVTVDGVPTDIYLNGLYARNRAFDSDIVVVQLLDKSKWKVLNASQDEGDDNEEDEEKRVEKTACEDMHGPTLESGNITPVATGDTGDAKERQPDAAVENDNEDKDEEDDDGEEEEDSSDDESESDVDGEDEKESSCKVVSTINNANECGTCEECGATHLSEEFMLKVRLEDALTDTPVAIPDSPPRISTILNSMTPVQTPNTPTFTHNSTEMPTTRVIRSIPTTPVSPATPMTPGLASDSPSHKLQEALKAIPTPQAAKNVIMDGVAEGLQPTGVVVYILESKHSDMHVGYIKSCHPDGVIHKEDRFVMFYPVDQRLPRALLPTGQVPGLAANPQSYADKIVLAKLCDWRGDSGVPMARFKKVVGTSGLIDVETEALLLEHGVDSRDFSHQVLKCLPVIKGNWKVPPEESTCRRDLRRWRIFTIDPATAKDLDDALSCRAFPDGTFEVGVHIADVSHFVHPGTSIDTEAFLRATTVYLVAKAIPMLPPLLAEQLCSLNMGVDRLAFSVIWLLDKNGNVIDEWFGRTVIRSCCRMSYEVAQLILEGKIKNSWPDALKPEQIHRELGPDGRHIVREIVQDILNLGAIAKNLRSSRFANGALAINQVKLSFQLDENNHPVSFIPYITRESNHLVEEFMLLANMRVAMRIAKTFPDSALLRRHPPPVARKMDEFVEFCASVGLGEIDASSAGRLASTLAECRRRCTSQAVDYAVQMLCTRPMQLAKYFCTGCFDEDDWHHYALNVDYYTHFTSPIRRYADVIVHRLLHAALLLDNVQSHEELQLLKSMISSLPDKERMEKIATKCNDKKLLAKRAQEASDKLYLCILLKQKPLVVDGIAICIGDRYISCLVPTLGMEKRIYLEDLQLESFTYNKALSKVTIVWPGGSCTQEIALLTVFQVVVLTKNKIPMDFEMKLVPPELVTNAV